MPSVGLSALDVFLVLLVMGLVTWMGHRLSGAIEDRRGFFEASGGLPWWAVAASIIATLVSSVTFVAVPAAVFRDGGSLTYFQVIVGLAVGKLFIAALLARAFYESQGIRSAYEYVGARMDRFSGELAMLLGLGLGVINSGLKLLSATIVLDVLTGWGQPACAAFVMAFSILWSALAGIKTVVWTDFLLFLLFAVGAVFALLFTALQIEQPIAEAWRYLDEQAKLVLFDFSTDPSVRYTLWSAILGSIALSIALGATQGTWQRVRACRSVGDAQKAYNYSAVFYVLHLFVLALGLALVVFYAENGLPAAVTSSLEQTPDLIFPYFIATELPTGVSAIFIATIFAAAISTLDSGLTETADVSVRHLYQQWLRPDETEAHYLKASRVAMVIWGVVFWAVAVFFVRLLPEGLLDLTFMLPNIVYGALFGTMILARFGIGELRSYLVGLVVCFAAVAVLASLNVAFFWWCPVSGLAMVASVWALDRRPFEMDGVVR